MLSAAGSAPPSVWETPRYEKPDMNPEVFEATTLNPEEVNWDDLKEQTAAYDSPKPFSI